MSTAVSAGILLYRRPAGRLQVLLAHPGGPFWARRDTGAWTIPKGVAETGEELEAVAMREFAEETGFDLPSIAVDPGRAPIELGTITLKSGKVVHGWAVEGDLDPDLAHSNEAEIEWPFDPVEGRRRLHPAQAAFIDRLELALELR